MIDLFLDGPLGRPMIGLLSEPASDGIGAEGQAIGPHQGSRLHEATLEDSGLEHLGGKPFGVGEDVVEINGVLEAIVKPQVDTKGRRIS